jgi:hypothetical protein
MKVEYQIKNFDPSKIANKYGFGDNGKANLFLANNAFRRMEKYVPRDTGALATTVVIKPGSVTYIQPYAHKQYVSNKGKGLRGKYWDKKMIANERDVFSREFDNYIKTLKRSS